MDPFDDFQIKPLTEGLGFHKKAVRLGDSVKQSKLDKDEINPPRPPVTPGFILEDHQSQSSRERVSEASRSAKEALAELMETLNHPPGKTGGFEPKVSQPLPRRAQETTEQKYRTSDPEFRIPFENPIQKIEIIDTPEPTFRTKQPRIEMPIEAPSVGVRRGAADSPIRHLVPTPVSISSAIVDGLLILALSLIFLLTLLVATQVELMRVISNSQQDTMTQISLLILFISVMQMYVMISRCFFGRTLGEWTFDLQMGTDKQIQKSTYPFLVVWRSVVVLATGIFVFPILSFIIRRDVTSILTGLQLYHRRF